ncbi:MAG: hypothetical protein HETSPECPRED_005152 [Heterodermia speciosa]|uniref:Uncharacterized protein n=1 Tax=Heterodermia speciosa TaxID=116794 RepID=A0A8H3IJ48_9LECA|nr:MAG: hypothetical protein HETSPECPRED_005152 [Heterodermia speciosa]
MCTTPILAYNCGHTEPTGRFVTCTQAYQNRTQCKVPTAKKVHQAAWCARCTIERESARLMASTAETWNRCERLGATEADMARIRPTEEQMRTWNGRGFEEESRGRSMRRY